MQDRRCYFVEPNLHQKYVIRRYKDIYEIHVAAYTQAIKSPLVEVVLFGCHLVIIFTNMRLGFMRNVYENLKRVYFQQLSLGNFNNSTLITATAWFFG